MRPAARRALRLGERALALVGAAWLCQSFVFEVSVTTTSCMAPLLVGRDRAGDHADWVVTERLLGARRIPGERFSVVCLEDDEGYPIVKRVVGFPGETLVLRADRTLLVNGRAVETPVGIGSRRGTKEWGYLPCGNLAHGRAYVVPEASVYVLGDDTGDAQDSRFTGAVPASRIRGHVVLAFRAWDRLTLL